MKKMLLLVVLMMVPAMAFAQEQRFSQHGLTATISLSPDKLEPNAPVQLKLRLEQDGVRSTDRTVRVAVYQGSAAQPLLSRPVDLLDGEYVDSWTFEQAGDYRVVVTVTPQQKPDDVSQYDMAVSVPEAGHGGVSHHFGGNGWGWWGMGAMMLIMVPVMIAVM